MGHGCSSPRSRVVCFATAGKAWRGGNVIECVEVSAQPLLLAALARTPIGLSRRRLGRRGHLPAQGG
jgi:hypothetical protein